MGESLRLIYTPHPDATPETEAAALSTVYRLILLDRVHAERAQDDEKENNDASAKNTRLDSSLETPEEVRLTRRGAA